MRLIEASIVGQEIGRPKLNNLRVTKGVNEIGWLTFEILGQPSSYTQRRKFHFADENYYDVFWLDSLQYDREKNITKYKCFDVHGVIAQRIVAYDGLIEDYGKDTTAPLDQIIYNILLKNHVSPYRTERSVLTSHGVAINLVTKDEADTATFTYGWLNALKAIQEVWKASNGRVNILPIWNNFNNVVINIYLDYFKDRTIYSPYPLVIGERFISKQLIDANFSKEINTAYAMSNKYVSGYKVGSVVETVNNDYRIEGYVGNSSAKTVADTYIYGQELIYRNRPYNQEISEIILNNFRLGTDYNIGTALSVKKPYGFDQNVIRGLDIMYKSERSNKEVRARIEKFQQSTTAVTVRNYGSGDTPIIT